MVNNYSRTQNNFTLQLHHHRHMIVTVTMKHDDHDDYQFNDLATAFN